jgi:hypothetical protein
MSNYLFGINSIGVPNVSNTPPYDNTLPASDCTNGNPKDLYAGLGVYSWEVLYSTYERYQSSAAVQFTKNQAINLAPGNNPVCEGPQNIFIIRHAEKNSIPPDYDLNNNGIARACQLVDYVNDLAENGIPISYIITINPCGYNTSDPSMRPVQTASVISFMLNIPLFIYGGANDYSGIVDALFPQINSPGTTGAFDGLNVIIITEHGCIQQLSLTILNSAGTIGRLPPSIQPTQGNSNFWGDSFFKSVNACPDGNYKCIVGVQNYNSEFDCTTNPPPSSIIPPPIIGPNSEYYPYWNNYNFSNIYWFKSNNQTNYNFDFSIINQPCYSCFPNCGLQIGLYQPVIECGSTPLYYNKTPTNVNLENNCEVPADWKV